MADIPIRKHMGANIVQNSVSDIRERFFRPIYGGKQAVITVDILSRHPTVVRVAFVNIRMEIVDVVQIRGSRVFLFLSVYALNDAVGDFLQMPIAFQSVRKRDASGCNVSFKRRFDFLEARMGAVKRDGVSGAAVSLYARHNTDLFV